MDNPTPQDICPFVSLPKRSSIFSARPPEALPPVFLLGPHSPDHTGHIPLQLHAPFCLCALRLPHHQSRPTHPCSMLSGCTGSSSTVNLLPTLIGHAAFLTEHCLPQPFPSFLPGLPPSVLPILDAKPAAHLLFVCTNIPTNDLSLSLLGKNFI